VVGLRRDSRPFTARRARGARAGAPRRARRRAPRRRRRSPRARAESTTRRPVCRSRAERPAGTPGHGESARVATGHEAFIHAGFRASRRDSPSLAGTCGAACHAGGRGFESRRSRRKTCCKSRYFVVSLGTDDRRLLSSLPRCSRPRTSRDPRRKRPCKRACSGAGSGPNRASESSVIPRRSRSRMNVLRVPATALTTHWSSGHILLPRRVGAESEDFQPLFSYLSPGSYRRLVR
jgi:hypothetical protein